MKINISIPDLDIATFSTVLFWILGLAILIDDRMLTLSAYIGFPNKWWLVFGMFTLAAIATYCRTQKGSTSRFCAGFVMLLAALGWAIIAAKFFDAFPPITLEMLIFSLLSGFCLMVGLKNINESRAIENADLDND